MLMWMDWMTAAGTLVGGLGTAGGLFWAARQLQLGRQEQQREERWRRTEFARGLVDRLSSDNELVFCTRALDWGMGPLIIPDRYRALFDPPCTTFEHNQSNMADALRADSDANWRSPQALTYRHCFDSFFSYIETIKYHVQVGNVEHSQLIGLEYYLGLIRKPPYLVITDKVHPFRPFLDRYYPGLSDFIWRDIG